MYNIEWIPDHDPHNCWNQYALVDSRWQAAWAKWDMKHAFPRHTRKRTKFRIREV